MSDFTSSERVESSCSDSLFNYEATDLCPKLNQHCFNDGVRKIDYVLAWEEELPSTTGQEARNQHTAVEMRYASRTAKCRHKFHKNLSESGFELEKEILITPTKQIHFLKLYVTWEAMCYYAEYLGLRVPLKQHSASKTSNCQTWLHHYNPLRLNIHKLPLYYTGSFNLAKFHKYIGSEDPGTFFEPTQRHRVAYEILGTCVYGQAKAGEIGIDYMMEEGIYSSAFPLHEGPHLRSRNTSVICSDNEQGHNETTDQQLNSRQILHLHWANWRMWYKYQPLDHVRRYFGEKIAFHFAWLGMYTAWLIPATVVGLLIFLSGFLTLALDEPTKDACNSAKSFKMCPICKEEDGCRFWYLSDICWKIKLQNLTDNTGTVLYSVFVSFWAVLFLEFWTRRTAALAHRWGVVGLTTEIEWPRPRYTINCICYRQNPVTKCMEPYFPNRLRLPRIILSTLCLICMLAIVLACILLIIACQTAIFVHLSRTSVDPSKVRLMANTAGSLLHLVSMVILEFLYKRVAHRLTEWEMHRTQCRFEDQLTVKMFIFEVFNYYSSIFYIAYFKGRFVGIPGDYTQIFGFYPEQCDEGGCLLDLALSLAIILFGRQLLILTIDLMLPKLLQQMHIRRKGLVGAPAAGGSYKPWESDYRLISYYDLLAESLQLVLQFGFVTIFVAAFPLAPLFALLNNWVKIRLDAIVLVQRSRRPLAESVTGIGVWSKLLEIIAAISVISNAFLIAFTSDFLPRMLYRFEYGRDLQGYLNFSLAWSPNNFTSQPCRYRQYRDSEGHRTPFYWKLLVVQLSFVIIFEHLVFSARHLIQVIIPDMPKELQVEKKREGYLGRQALIDLDFHRLSQENGQETSPSSDMSRPSNVIQFEPESRQSNFFASGGPKTTSIFKPFSFIEGRYPVA